MQATIVRIDVNTASFHLVTASHASPSARSHLFRQCFASLHAPLHDSAACQWSDLLFTVNRGFDLNQIAFMFPTSVQEDIFYDLHHTLIRQACACVIHPSVFIRVLAGM